MAAEEVHREDSCLEVSRLISKRSNDPYWLRVQRPRSWENTACQTYVRWGFGDFRALDAVHKSGICTQAQELLPRLYAWDLPPLFIIQTSEVHTLLRETYLAQNRD
jgi:hypothetical protein